MGGSEETEVANLDKAFGENVLEEALDELLGGEGAAFELSGIRSAILERDLRLLQAAVIGEGEQAAIADGHSVDIGSEIFERGLPVAHGQAMDDPFQRPHFGGNG